MEGGVSKLCLATFRNVVQRPVQVPYDGDVDESFKVAHKKEKKEKKDKETAASGALSSATFLVKGPVLNQFQ